AGVVEKIVLEVRGVARLQRAAIGPVVAAVVRNRGGREVGAVLTLPAAVHRDVVEVAAARREIEARQERSVLCELGARNCAVRERDLRLVQQRDEMLNRVGRYADAL